ncbi:hypothetical protein HHI36_022071 [Cryptolaemus montrouzieri]|uniref:Ionotropic receptor n=1 Tax=Cryptolaemus montrouzieri TaxID=559131 RepID=A0ABD2MYS3_9CUCU
MIAVVFLSVKTLCINYLLLNYNSKESYAVIATNEVAFPFPAIRVDVDTFSGFEHIVSRTPNFYIIDIDTETLNITQFLSLRKKLGFSNYTKYLFVGEKLFFDFESNPSTKFTASLMLINPQNYEVWKRTIELGRKSMSSTDTETIMDNSFFCGIQGNENSRFIQEFNVTVYFFYGPPYTLCENCENRGIVLEMISMALDLLNIERKFVGNLFLNPDVKKIIDSIFLEDSGAIFLGVPVTDEYDFTQPFLYDNAYWILRTPDEIPRWRYIIRIFSSEVWTVWLLSSVLLSLAWFATIYRRTRNHKTLTHYIEGLLIILKHFIEQPHILKPSSLSQNIVLYTLLLSTFLMNLFFESKFSYILTGFNYEKSIESFEDMMRNELQVEFPDYFLEFFEGDLRALKYFEKYRTGTENTLRVVAEENKATGYPDIMFLYELHNYLDSNQRPLLRKLKPPIMTVFINAVLREGNPLKIP